MSLCEVNYLGIWSDGHNSVMPCPSVTKKLKFPSSFQAQVKWHRPIGSRYRSQAWKHFKLNETGMKVACDHCDAQLTHIGGTTATMLKHVKTQHPTKWIPGPSGDAPPTSSASTLKVTPAAKKFLYSSCLLQENYTVQVPINIAFARD